MSISTGPALQPTNAPTSTTLSSSNAPTPTGCEGEKALQTFKPTAAGSKARHTVYVQAPKQKAESKITHATPMALVPTAPCSGAITASEARRREQEKREREAALGGALIIGIEGTKARFFERDGIIIVSVPGVKQVRQFALTNFSVDFVALVIFHKTNGDSDLLLLIRLTLASTLESVEKAVPLAQPEQIMNLLDKKSLAFRLNPESGKQKVFFLQFLSMKYEGIMGKLPIRHEYECAGWFETEGFQRYISSDSASCRSKRRLADLNALGITSAQAFMIHREILRLGKRETLLLLLLHVCEGFLAKFLEDVGSPLQHMLALIGPTGSFKTSVAKELCCVFELDDAINFTSTERALDLMLERSHDGVLLLDDLHACGQKELLAKLNRVLRQVGDTTGRMKSVNLGRKLEKTNVRCAVVLTAESQLHGLQQSGRLRTLFVPCERGSIETNVLTDFQRNRRSAHVSNGYSKMELFLTGFIRFVEKNYEWLRKAFSTLEPPPMRLYFARQGGIFRNLYLAATLLLTWGESEGAITREEATSIMMRDWLPIFQSAMLANEAICRQEDPWRMFLRAIFTGIGETLFPIAPTKETFVQNAAAFAGFHEGDFLKVLPDRAYEFAGAYLAKSGQKLNAPLDDILSALHEQGVSEGYVEKGRAKPRPTKKMKLNGTTVPVLCIRWNVAQEKIEEGDDRHE